MNPLLPYYRCPEKYVRGPVAPLHSDEGPQFGREVTCNGDDSEVRVSVVGSDFRLHDAVEHATATEITKSLPFDPAELVDYFRLERYVSGDSGGIYPFGSPLASIYYSLRPLLPVSIRKHLQRVCLRQWSELRFPTWPVDRTVDNICQKLLLASLGAQQLESIPFIWFWPEAASSCAIMTHDVETKAGRDYCKSLMNIDESFNIQSSFQIVPEKRYPVPDDFLAEIRDRGFEINVQDLNHDGFLYRTYDEFLRRVEKINVYGQKFCALGFRSAALYRRQEWYDALRFEYDMSVPNVAHLDPQRGGCCTVMPYFVGDILELPVTTTQDYSLFHILNTHSLDLWRQQIELIRDQHGLISFIVHPDYVQGGAALRAYKELLSYLALQRESEKVWITTPAEVNRWWRQRSRMTLIREDEEWRIEGDGKERARIAYASNDNGKLVMAIVPQSIPSCGSSASVTVTA